MNSAKNTNFSNPHFLRHDVKMVAYLNITIENLTILKSLDRYLSTRIIRSHFCILCPISIQIVNQI